VSCHDPITLGGYQFSLQEHPSLVTSTLNSTTCSGIQENPDITAQEGRKKMASTVVSQADVDALAKAIKGAPQPHAMNVGDFCRLWAQVKPILTSLQPIVGLIPVVGAIAAAAIATLLTIGNAAATAMCGGQ
jgi:hypothetical protein